MKKYSKYAAILTLFVVITILSISEAEGLRYVKYNFTEGTILSTGSYSDTNTPATNINAIAFVCSSENCSTVGGALNLSNGNIITDINNPPIFASGNSDSILATYPTLQSSFGYGIYFYKENYIPWEQSANWWGDGLETPQNPQGPYTKVLRKKEGCFAPIENFTVLNDVEANLPLIVDVVANLSTDTLSAIKSAGPLEYVPPQLLSHYSVNTSVRLDIKNSAGTIVKTETKYVMINYSGSAHVSFSWTLAINGTYTASVTTGVPDAKCLSFEPKSQSKGFTVWSEAPRNACYTLLNGLSASPTSGIAGQPIIFKYNKTSNFANDTEPWDPNYLIPVATNVTYKILNSTKDVVFSDAKTLAANPTNSTPTAHTFTWTPAIPGAYNVTIMGIANDANCVGKTNPEESISFDNLGVLDTIIPAITITYPANGQTFTVPTIVVNGTASDNIGLSKVEIKVNSGVWQLASGTTSWASSAVLSAGANTIYAKATDTSNNTKIVSVTVTYNPPDTTPPTISITHPSASQIFTTPTITINGTAFDNVALSKVEVKVNSGSWQLANGTALWNATATLISGTNTIYAKATDTSGNEKNTSVTVMYNAPDTTPPSNISNLTAGTPTESSIMLSWTAPGDDGDIGTASQYDIRYSISPMNDTNWGNATQVSAEPEPSIAGTIQTFAVTGLASSTTYYFAIKAADEVPNWSGLSNVANQTTDTATPPTPPPITPSGGGGGGSSGGYYSRSSADNKNAHFSNMSVPASITHGEILWVSGCMEKLGKNGTIEMFLDGTSKIMKNVSAPSTCFKLSAGAPAIGKHQVYLWLNGTNIDFTKSVTVTAKEGEIAASESGVNIIDISANESIIEGIPVILRVFVQADKPIETTLRLFLDGIEIGKEEALISGQAVFSFKQAFKGAGIKTLKAVAKTGGGEEIFIKKIDVKKSMPTGGFLSNLLKNPGIAALIAAIIGAGYYAYQKGYLMAAKVRISSWLGAGSAAVLPAQNVIVPQTLPAKEAMQAPLWNPLSSALDAPNMDKQENGGVYLNAIELGKNSR